MEIVSLENNLKMKDDNRRHARFNSFNSEFEKRIGQHPNYKKAYEATSEHFRSLIGIDPYSDYDSFRITRSRIIKSK